MNRPTISDLANAAGVSVSTVNRPRHGSTSVRQDTIDQILEAAEEIGFYGFGTIRDRGREALRHRRAQSGLGICVGMPLFTDLSSAMASTA
jgi:LacI family transcriptional regulator